MVSKNPPSYLKSMTKSMIVCNLVMKMVSIYIYLPFLLTKNIDSCIIILLN
jgi:hypothetical protein